MSKYLEKIGLNAKIAFENKISNKKKNKVLNYYAELISKNKNKILNENSKDIKVAKSKKLKENLIKRLALNNEKIKSIIKSIKIIANFKDPVDVDLETWKRPNGLKIKKVSIPIGIIGIIYESRPNVTSDVSTLCFKSGNCVILRGGSEAYFSNKILAHLFRKSLEKNKINKNFVQFIENKNRKLVEYMLSKMTKYIDVIVPRGGRSLTERVGQESKVAVLKHLDGICHIYLDAAADPIKAETIAVNAKMRRTGVCGAAETILVHKDAVETALPNVVKGLLDSGCEVRGDSATQLLDDRVLAATAEDWDTEYLAPIVSIKVVEGLQDAILHVGKHGSHHTDSIITEDNHSAEEFMKRVDSGIVLHNASTQFADGGEFGMGAEIGISTGKLHARGPVGVEQLTSYKYLVRGEGQVRP